MRSLPASAVVAKYSHHIPTLATTDERKAAIVAFVHSRAAKVAAVTGTDSPSAIITTSPQRSAMWPPPTLQPSVVDPPSLGPQKPTDGEMNSNARARNHSHQRVLPSAKPPATQNTPANASHARMRWKVRAILDFS